MFPFGREELSSGNLIAVAREANASTVGKHVFFLGLRVD
jgi:hypothetical protein